MSQCRIHHSLGGGGEFSPRGREVSLSFQGPQQGKLTVATVNSTSWQPFKKWWMAQQTLPDLIALQEHKLRSEADIQEASAYLKKQGYASYWSPATAGPKGLPAGGVAVVVSTRLGTKPCETVASPGRLVACKVQVQNEAEIIFASVYLHSGKGLKQVNLELLGVLAAAQRQESKYLVAAGDWQNQAKALDSVGWLARAGLGAHTPAKATCIMKKTSSTIDFFITSRELCPRCERPTVQLNKHIATHRPVLMSISTSVEHAEPRVREAQRMPPTPSSPTGPYNKPACWRKAEVLVLKAVAAARVAVVVDAGSKRHHTKMAQRLQDKAYSEIINTVEQEISSKFDIDVVQPGRRARPANIVWVKSQAMQPKGQIRVQTGALPYRWMLEQCHKLHQHLTQTLALNPKKVDDETMAEYQEQLNTEVPDYIHGDLEAEALYEDLVAITSSVLVDQESGVLVDSRPAAFQALRCWTERMQKAQDKAEAQYRMAAHNSWRKWAIEAASAGAGRAHRWTQLPESWRPAVAKKAPQDHNAEPIHLLNELHDKYKPLWKPAGVPIALPQRVMFPDWIPRASRACSGVTSTYNLRAPSGCGGDPTNQQRITSKDVREASRSFRVGTAQTYDGVHVRHWASLEERGQDIVAKLMCLSLALGTLPRQIRAVIATAIPKAKAGYRTIGLFSAYYRTLVRTTSPSMRQWELHHPRKFYSFSAGKSAVLTVWAQTAHLEMTSAIGKPSSATILWDLSDFYEGMSRSKLLHRELAQDFPSAPAFLSIRAYAGERILQLNGIAVSAGHPTRGVVPGCGLATFHVQAYHGPPMQAFVDSFPHLALNIHIDDFGLTATARSDDEVVQQISTGAAALEATIHSELECAVSIPKADVIATSDKLLRRMGSILERYGKGASKVSAINLGIEVTGGQPIRRAEDRMLRARFKKQTLRKGRIQRLARVNRPGATKVFNQGVVAAIEYGTQVWGYSNADLRDLQSFFLSTVAPPGKGKSRTLSLLLWDSCSWRPALAPIISYAKVLWQALVSPGIAVVPLATLVGWYRKAATSVHPRNWGDVCGPFSALTLSLSRIGWAQLSFATFQDHNGLEHNVASIGPKMLESKLKSAWKDRQAEQAAQHVAATFERNIVEESSANRGELKEVKHRPSVTEAHDDPGDSVLEGQGLGHRPSVTHGGGRAETHDGPEEDNAHEPRTV